MPARPRVAILGGGIAGLTAAFELSETGEYDITIYTMGSRLGGKGASSRNAEAGHRVEEHGLHLWFGFYENAFDLMRRTYAAMDPPQYVEDRFLPVDEIVLGEEYKQREVLRGFHPPYRPGEPGVGDHSVDFWSVLEIVLAWLADLAARAATPASTLRRVRSAIGGASSFALGVPRLVLDGGLGPARLRRDLSRTALSASRRLSSVAATALPTNAPLPAGDDTDEFLRRRVAQALEEERGDKRDVLDLAHRLSELRARHARPLGPEPHTPVVMRLLSEYVGWLEDAVLESALDDDEARYLFYAVDTVTAALSGIVAEDLAVRGFAAIDDRDLREWLKEHGAHALTLENAPFIRGLYDLVFAYRDGDTSRPDLAAGKAIQAMIRLSCGYKGALLYRLNDGMDETVFQPLYEVLRDRGVEFRFCHVVTNLAIEDRAVTKIELQPQVELESWTYPMDTSLLKLEYGIDLERGESVEGVPPLTLVHGAEENGFEHVVLAIAGGALEPVCGELAAEDRRFRDMLANTKTVATQALQVWLTKPLREIGWPHAPDAVLSAYYEPMATFAPMGHLRGGESWPPGAPAPADIGYFCGPLADGAEPAPYGPLAAKEEKPVGMWAPDDEEEPEPAGAAALRAARGGPAEVLGKSFAALLGAGKAFAAFDWNVLFDPHAAEGGERLDRQFWRGNTAPSERYVTTYAGTPQHRLAPDASGFRNLTLAGDWTRNGIDGGCMEAAVASGRLAARAISGRPAMVPGTTGWLVDSGWAPSAGTYVQYGGLTTIASPYRCDDATLHGFWARADPARLDRLCERVFSEPSGGRLRFEAVGSHVMITWGRIRTVSSLDPAFEDVGTVNEDQVAIWVPVLGPQGFAMFVAYIWLDNPMSLTTGREVLGYPKTWGRLEFAPEGSDEPFGLQSFGLVEKGQRADFSPLLEVAIQESADPLEVPLASIHDLAWHAARELLPDDPAELLRTVGAGTELLSDFARSRMRSVFLKQVPAVEGSSGAALQQITETSYVIRRLRAWPLGHTYRLEVHPTFSHPLADDLGLESQAIDLAYRCEMDFDVRDSRVLWPS